MIWIKKLVWRSKHNDEVDREGVPVDEEGGDVEVVERAGRGWRRKGRTQEYKTCIDRDHLLYTYLEFEYNLNSTSTNEEHKQLS